MSGTVTNPPQWYIDEIQALIPEAILLYEHAKPVLDRYEAIQQEINDGDWSDRTPGNLYDEAVSEHGLDQLDVWLGAVGTRFQELDLTHMPEEMLEEMGVVPLTTHLPWAHS